MDCTKGAVVDGTDGPDIMPDPRDLDDHEFDCAIVPDGTKVDSVTLRAATGLVNVGNGEFRVILDESGGQPIVYQEIDLSNSGVTQYLLPSDTFIDHSSHGHFHLKDWVELRLLEANSGCNVHPTNQNSNCVVASGGKISFCALNTDEFDDELIELYAGGAQQGGSCNTEQRISPGWKDRYGNSWDGQAIHLGTPSGFGNILEPGNYLLEAYWDPTGIYHQSGELRDPTNTASRISITVPEFTTANTLSGNENCEQITDCSGFPSIAEGDERRRCQDHLRCEDDSDCLQWGLECKEVGFDDHFDYCY